MEKWDGLYQKLMELPTDKHSLLLSRLFGRFEAKEASGEEMSPDEFFSLVDEVVGSVWQPTDNEGKEPCSVCGGVGEVCDLYDSAFGTTEHVWHACDWCDGTGVEA